MSIFGLNKGNTLTFSNKTMDYTVFGKGDKHLVILPGLGDGFKTVKGLDQNMRMMFKPFEDEYKVYVFSRINELQDGYSIRDMSNDLAEALKELKIEHASILGVSQGGMVAQCFAIDHQDMVDKLVLVSTTARSNEYVQKNISKWLEYAKNNNYKDILIDSSEKTYSDDYLLIARVAYPVVTRIGVPKDLTRFMIQARATINFDVLDELYKISCPTFIVGGKLDQIVGPNASQELKEHIHNSEIYEYEEYGHGLYEEAKDFNQRVKDFLEK